MFVPCVPVPHGQDESHDILDEVEAAVVRKKQKTAKLNEKARAHANKMNAVDVPTTTLAETTTDLDEEITSFGNSKGALRTYISTGPIQESQINSQWHLSFYT
jgi:hypothetical protein